MKQLEFNFGEEGIDTHTRPTDNPDMDYETLASAFALLHGNPPKSLRYRGRLFSADDNKAKLYRAAVEEFVRAQHPHETRTRELCRWRRNDVLRALYAQLGIESK